MTAAVAAVNSCHVRKEEKAEKERRKRKKDSAFGGGKLEHQQKPLLHPGRRLISSITGGDMIYCNYLDAVSESRPQPQAAAAAAAAGPPPRITQMPTPRHDPPPASSHEFEFLSLAVPRANCSFARQCQSVSRLPARVNNVLNYAPLIWGGGGAAAGTT